MAQRVPQSSPAPGGRAVLYIRVSAVMGRTGEEFLSPELQEAAMRRLIAVRGLREVAVIPDIDQSGRTFDREGLDKIRAMAEARQVDALVVNDLTRLGRNAGEAILFIGWLRQRGVTVLSTVENVEDQSPAGKLNTGVALLIAEMHSDQISQKWQQTIEHRARQGKAHGRAPIGYLRQVDAEAPAGRFDRRPTRLVVDPIMGPIMAGIFVDYAAGHPISKLAQRLKAGGRSADLTTLRRALRNPAYLGKTVLWRAGGHRRPSAHADAAVTADGLHPELVTRDVWDKVQRRLQADAKTPERRHLAMQWSLAGLAECYHCEKPLQLHHGRVGAKPEKVDRLLCGSKRRVNPTACDGCGTPMLDQVEAATLTQLAQWAANLRSTPALQHQRQVHLVAVDSQREALNRDLADTKAAQTKLVAGWTAGKVPDDAYEENIAALLATERAVRARLAELAEDQPGLEPGVALRLVDEVATLWPQARSDERRIMLSAVVRRIRVQRPERWREPVADRVIVEFRW